MRYFTLYQLNKSIRKLIEGINKEFWITAEIANIQLSTHGYVELVQKEDDQIIAKSRAIIWHNVLVSLYDKFGDDLDNLLKTGSKILIKVAVTYHEVHGISIVIFDVDPNYTLGELERKRLETIEKLTASGLIDKQKQLKLPLVVQKVAIITSELAAGYTDFLNHIIQNEYLFRFEISLFPAAVQGEKAETEIIAQIKKASLQPFDAILLIRGGGSKLDLEVFNSYNICVAIAESSKPVISGIGHHRDISVVDLVANTSVKTPTAVAGFLIQRALDFKIEISSIYQNIIDNVKDILVYHSQRLQMLQQRIQREVSQAITTEKLILNNHKTLLQTNTNHFLKNQHTHLKNLKKQLEILDPENVLARGYSITYKNKKAVSSIKNLKKGDEITTKMKDGEVKSKVSG